MANDPKPSPPPPPPVPQPESFQRQVEILREIGASQQTIRIAEAAAQAVRRR
jgi:hypothetical protein